jgi:FKBP-type peptidyl-prolyl cis-trans isomerase SlyD
MQIVKDKVATFDYELKDENGVVLDTSEGHQGMVYLHGADNIVPGLETAMEGKTIKDSFSVVVQAEEGYGLHNESMIQTVPMKMFDGAEVAVGAQFHAENPEGEPIAITVKEVNGDDVVIDGNHPLAGVNLHFDIIVTDVRDATTEELAHGHAHGVGSEHNH